MTADLQARALHVLETVFGYPAFRGQQAEIIDAVTGGEDALVLMPTGGGKSLCYQIPALVREGTGVVISPLIALMHDQVDALEQVGVRAAYLNSTQTLEERRDVERRLLAGELDLPSLLQVSVDTVERYQGSQRDVIIVSFCCHHEHQIELMVSPDETGQVDRKLNVALTRARQQLILLGNEQVLSRAPHHAALLRRVGASLVS